MRRDEGGPSKKRKGVSENTPAQARKKSSGISPVAKENALSADVEKGRNPPEQGQGLDSDEEDSEDGAGSINSKEKLRATRSEDSHSSSEEEEDDDGGAHNTLGETRHGSRKSLNMSMGHKDPPKVIKTTTKSFGGPGAASPGTSMYSGGGLSGVSERSGGSNSQDTVLVRANETKNVEMHVRRHLFPKVKMITNVKMLKFGGKIQRNVWMSAICEKHRQGRSDVTWWDDNKSLVRRTLNTRRNNVTEAIKKSFMKGKMLIRHGVRCRRERC